MIEFLRVRVRSPVRQYDFYEALDLAHNQIYVLVKQALA